MSRLTYKLDEPIKTLFLNYEYKRIPDYDIDRGNFGRISNDMIFNKLGQLEDIEEELGMELKVYHKLMNMLYCGKKYPNILYVKDKDTIVQVGILEIDYCKKKIIFYKDKSYNEDYVYAFIQYGKTFALTIEELENEKTKNI